MYAYISYWTSLMFIYGLFNFQILFQSGNKKEAEKLVKNIIKVIIKLGVLYRSGQFSPEELQTADKFWNKFQVNIHY